MSVEFTSRLVLERRISAKKCEVNVTWPRLATLGTSTDSYPTGMVC